MHNLITVATQMFHGLLVVYQDSVVENPDEFARKALHLADRLLAGAAQSKYAGANNPPPQSCQRTPQEVAEQIALIISSNEELLSQLRALNRSQGPRRDDRTLH